MNYNTNIISLILSNSLIWIFLIAFFAGLFTRNLFLLLFKKKKILLIVLIYLFLIIITIILTYIFCDINNLFTKNNLIIFLIIYIIILFALKFKKTIGILSLILIVSIIIVVALFYKSIEFFTGKTEICKLKVLSRQNNIMKIEYNIRGKNNSNIIEMEGDYFAPVAKLIILDDYLIFLGARTAYRLIGFTSFILSNGIPIQKDIISLENPIGISDFIYKFIEKNEKFIPGIKTAQIEITLKKLEPMLYYVIIINNKGGMEVIQK